MALRAAFILLSVLAVVLMQGIFVYYGGWDAIMTHAKEGMFRNGKTLHHVYTGYPFIDGVLPMSVGMWDPLLHQARSATLLSRAFSASLQTLGVFAMLESQRRGCKNIVLRWAPMNILTWQLLGAAVFIPLYFMLELEQFAQGVQDPTVPDLHAKALLPASVLTILHLYRMVYFPPEKITSSQHQAWMAVWQLGPLLCYCAMASIVSYFTPTDTKRTVESPRSRNADALWLKAVFAVYGVFSAAMHLAVLWELVSTDDASVTYESIFVPLWSKLGHPKTVVNLHNEETKFFLQVDYIIIVLGAAIYVTVILDRIYAGLSRAQQAVVFLLATGASYLLSFGFVIAAALFVREDWLRSRVVVGKKDESVTK